MSLKELLGLGFVKNPHLYIGSGFMYCAYCRVYRYFEAYSRPAGNGKLQEDRMVCKDCSKVA